MKELQKLLVKYKDGTATKEEIAFIEQYYQYFEDQAEFSASLSESEKKEIENENWGHLAARIEQPLHTIPPHQLPFFRKWRWAAAASIILAIGFGGWFFLFNKKEKQAEVVQSSPTNDVKPPETNRASITLGNGQMVYLDSTATGSLAVQGNVKLVKIADGQIAYIPAEALAKAGETYNTLSNPRGSKVIDMMLADGSRVWLNAGSSVTYPVAFIGNERKVHITGEAYFEVAHDAGKPFYVTKGDMQVEVLGTHFNVNTYDDEATIKVSLLEGSVRLTLNAESKMLKPGEQAQINHGNPSISKIMVQTADIQQAIAWKNGLFSFTDADLPTVMRQLARWYNVEVEYEGKIPNEEFNGEIDNTLTLSQLLKGLAKTRINYRIETGNKIIILP